MATVSQQTELPLRVEEWMREQVYYWLTEVIKVDKKYADKLYKEEVSGKELVCYNTKYLKELDIRHGPAVLIITSLKKLKKKQQESELCSELNSDNSYTQHPKARLDTTVENKDSISTDQTKISKNTNESKRKSQKTETDTKIITEIGKDSKDNIAQSNNEIEDSKLSEPLSTPSSQNQNILLSGTSVCTSETTESADHTTSSINADKVAETEKHMRNSGSVKHSCSLYPFDQTSASHRYIQNYTLPPETGPGNLIDPVHEYKFMGRTDDINIMKKKFNQEVFRFAAGCMNRRTNGTIHFGVADSKGSQFAHAEIIGISVDKKDVIIDHFNQGIQFHFGDHSTKAQECIRQPRFVEVLCPDSTLSGKYVIEVDVVPSHSIVHGELFYIQTLDDDNQGQKKKSKEKSLFLRKGAATHNIIKNDDTREIYKGLNDLDNLRKEAENRPLSKGTSNQGEKLKNLLTCGESTLDHYNYYIIVTNKSYPEQLQHLQFMTTLKPFCVLDFDPNSVINGSCKTYSDIRIVNLRNPSQFHGDPGTIVNNLKTYETTSWVFCNGRKDLNTESDRPLQPSEWLKQKAGKVENIISFICNPDVLPRGRFLVIFLLLSTVEAMNDPIFDTFLSFYKQLGGAENTLTICNSEDSFKKWRDYTESKCELDITQQCVYDLELSEINGTILKLSQNKQTAQRLLPSAERSTVILPKKDEEIMASLNILCENECENEFDESSAEFEEFRIKTESEYYKGGDVKWWNFYFSEQPGAKPFIKRDKYSKLENCIRSQIKNTKSTCDIVNLFHHPGCGGTTMAMHVMWNLRKEFRCAVLKDSAVSKEEVAQHVVHLINCGKSELSFKIPALLLVEDHTKNILKLQQSLRTLMRETGGLVIILNCIRTNTPQVKDKENCAQSEFITANLSKKEKNAFTMKLKELQKVKSFTTENFYSFMIMKTNFDKRYVKEIADNILKDFKVESKAARLLGILALLNSHLIESAMPNNACEFFLGIKSTFWGIESVLEKMEPYSCMLVESGAEKYGIIKGIRFVHQHLATECLKNLECTGKYPCKDIIGEIFQSFYSSYLQSDLLHNQMDPELLPWVR